jgi:DNA-binding NtrC family response regulator
VSGPIAVLILGGGDALQADLRGAFARKTAYVESVAKPAEADPLTRRCHFDAVILIGGRNELRWWKRTRAEGLVSRAVLISNRLDNGLLLDALRSGVEDVFEMPLDARAVTGRILMLEENRPVAPAGGGLPDEPELVGDCDELREIKTLIERIAPLPATVLIEGETGTGKELIARRIHSLSGRRGPFVAVNCGAIAPELLESELFGHRRGAFTSAHQGRDGLFVAAAGGTLFLDEISEMPVAMEVKLLRALEESAIRPVGADREIPVDVRIVASTQHDLPDRVREGRFREDLFYRLNVIHLVLPPLRQRAGDIVRLAEHFSRLVSAEAGLPAVDLDAAARARLTAHAWPGNVRELRNLIERATLMGQFPANEPGPPAVLQESGGWGYPLDWTLDQVKIDHMRRMVDACGGNKSLAARRLGVSRKTLDRKLPAG